MSFLARFGTGDARNHLHSIESLGRAIMKTVSKIAGKSQENRRTLAVAGSLLHPVQRTAQSAHPAKIARPLQARQRLDAVPGKDPSSPRTSGQRKRPDTQCSRCHEVEGSVHSLNKAAGLCAAVQEPAALPTLPTPKILSAIIQNRSMNPPETFLGGGTPSSYLSLRTRLTLPPHNGISAIVCLDAFGSPRGERRG